MTEPAASDAAGVNEARWLRRECVCAHAFLALLLGLGTLVGWRGAEALGVSGPQGILSGLTLPACIYFIYSIVYGFRVWVSMVARLEHLSHSLDALIASQKEGFASVAKHFDAKTGATRSGADVNEEQERALVARLEKENADWLYDAKGNATKEGAAVRNYIEQARRLGIKGAQARWDYAIAMVERDLLQQWVEKNREPADSGQRAVETRDAPPPLL